MKLIKYLILGVAFGVIMAKSEAISWYRIQEMFRFQSFHMYGIIATAVGIGMMAMQIIKKLKLTDPDGNPIHYTPKKNFNLRYIIGGTIFGLGWALAGACPGPLFVNLGYGFISMIVVILFALLGTYVYGVNQDKFPH